MKKPWSDWGAFAVFVLIGLLLCIAARVEAEEVVAYGSEVWMTAQATEINGHKSEQNVGAVAQAWLQAGSFGTSTRLSVTGVPGKFTTSAPETFTGIALALEVHYRIMRFGPVSCGAAVAGEYGVPLAEQDGESPVSASPASLMVGFTCTTTRGGPWAVGGWGRDQALEGPAAVALVQLPLGAKTALQCYFAAGERRTIDGLSVAQHRTILSAMYRF